ncbi:TetR/AcrR family transcriptional regulator [Sphingomonas quercus]|uniref:TetR/AcrR family transcriptional regulator n=1 Tax=Sphingomonas quercus TaxID=2842451 RepID=A0ABS6BGN0_9SPHN|nr:TetR/AcrR family transcriptional regulator [Sphingomonas quercus]MBU3077453.1 TetR/AcrR family transcriptional regulator [Sphingomonas quercus]
MIDGSSHKERTRARILDAAAQAMRTAGVEGIGVAALMKRAGLTHGGFYAHFSSRDDLVAHAIARMFEDSRALVADYFGDEDPARGLAGLIDAYLSDEARTAPGLSCPLPSLAGEAARLPEGARDQFVAGIEAMQQALATGLAALGHAEPARLAASALAEMTGAVALSRAFTDESSASGFLAAARATLKQRLGL